MKWSGIVTLQRHSSIIATSLIVDPLCSIHCVKVCILCRRGKTWLYLFGIEGWRIVRRLIKSATADNRDNNKLWTVNIQWRLWTYGAHLILLVTIVKYKIRATACLSRMATNTHFPSLVLVHCRYEQLYSCANFFVHSFHIVVSRFCFGYTFEHMRFYESI